MILTVYTLYHQNIKVISHKYVYLTLLKNIKKNYFIFFKYKFIYFSICTDYILFKSISSFLYNLFKGFCYKLSLEGKRFKFLINNYFLFFKMDISHFKFLRFKGVLFLKKLKKNKLLYFYSFDLSLLKYSLLNIQNLKKPTKYKKKGLFLKKIY